MKSSRIARTLTLSASLVLPAAAQAPPGLKLAWKTPCDARAFRLGVGDTVGDGRQRLVLLSVGAGGGMRLGVYSWNLVAFAEEWSTELGKVAPALAVGRFAPGVPVCQIVVPGAFYNWNGKEYARRTTTRPLVPMGTLRTRTGDEQLLVREASDFSVFTIDPKAEGEAWLKKSASPLAAGPAGKEYSRGVLHIPEPEMKAAFPPVVAAVGLMAFWDAANDNKPLRLAGRFSDKGSISNLVLLGPAGKETWRSEALDGRIGDVSFGDPKGEGREGLLVLTASNGGKERTIYFLTAS